MNLSKNGSNKRKIQRKGGVEAIVTAIKTHSNDRDVQDIGCQTLGILAVSAVNEKEIAAKGGIHVIVAAMQAHLDDRGIQDEACKALFNFTFGSKHELGEANALKGVKEAKARFDLDTAKKFIRHLQT